MPLIHKNVSVHTKNFSMVPKSDVPRSAFRMQKGLKTAFDAGYLIPVFCEEVLPGDTFTVRMTAFARLATPIFPVMDNLHLESFFFFVPNRLVWTNWVKFMGEQDNPADSIAFVVPQNVSPAGGHVIGSVFDYLGLPTVGQVAGGATVSYSALPLRGYYLIYDRWFRDENLQTRFLPPFGDGPDTGQYASVGLMRRGKRHDYFTGCLPWTQKGGTSISLPLGTSATVRVSTSALVTGAQPASMRMLDATAGAAPTLERAIGFGTDLAAAGGVKQTGTAVTTSGGGLYPSNLYADLSTATAATINQLRQSFQIQRFLEKDARGGTRYTELLQSHFGVRSPDSRLQRPEYLGGGSSPVIVHPIAQTTATGLTGGSTPLGNLSGAATAVAQHGFTSSFVEHGYVFGLVNVRADLTYQQGLRRHWSRSTRYDFYHPVFAYLGEQSVLNKEIYVRGDANDALVFGYQERWAEYRYLPSEITGIMRSTAASTIDAWHLAQRFTSLPTLNGTFIEDNPPVSRVLAVGAGANGQQLLMDAVFDVKAARPLPMYSVPGLVDHL